MVSIGIPAACRGWRVCGVTLEAWWSGRAEAAGVDIALRFGAEGQVDGRQLSMTAAQLKAVAEGVAVSVPVVADLAALAVWEAAQWEAGRERARAAGAQLVGEGIYLGPEVTLAAGAVVVGPAHMLGRTVVGSGAVVLAGAWLVDTEVGAGAQIKPHTVAERAVIGAQAQVGPSAHLRPGTVLGAGCKVGNFVETKNAVLADGAKASHLTYLGDCSVGEAANIGAGTITCNYDGANKHRTEIGDGAFVGTNSSLVAPVAIGAGALVAAGSVVTKDVPDGGLALGRARQVTKEGLGARILAENHRRKAEASKA